MTQRQKELLYFIYESMRDCGYSPTLEEMRDYLGVVSNQAVLDLLKKLEAEGLIKKDISISSRNIKILDNGFKILGEKPLVSFLGITSAGVPLEAVEISGEWITTSTSDVSQLKDDVFLLKISGDSMINAGIEDGDAVLVRGQKEFVSGDIVLAKIGDESTVKRFISDDRPPYIYLKPENPKYEIIPFNEETRLVGKVISILKNGRLVSLIDNKIDFIKEEKEDKKDKVKNIIKKPYLSTKNILIYNQDILKIESIPESSIDLIITSPPYNVDIYYNSHNDNLSYEDYLEFTQKWIRKCYDLAKSEGRFLLNIPLDKNKGGQKSVGADITKIAKDIGWKYHSTIIWNEGNISRRTAWGSFMSASAPYVIAPVELILVLYKDSWKKTGGSRKNDITKQEFMDWTNGVWTFNGQSKKGAGGHPAPFPIELPRRCIKLFSFIGDTVLDPFLGSGSTLIASYLHGRKGIGVDIDEKYCNIAIDRLHQEAKLNQSSLIK